jgi:hypothetical protein
LLTDDGARDGLKSGKPTSAVCGGQSGCIGPNQSGNNPSTNCGELLYCVKIRVTAGKPCRSRSLFTAGPTSGSIFHLSPAQNMARFAHRGHFAIFGMPM